MTKSYLKKLAFSLVFMFFNVVVFAQKATDDFSGKYKTPNGKTIVISKSNCLFVGKEITSSSVVMKDVKFEDGKWKCTLINNEKNKIFEGELYLEATQLKIIAKSGFLSKTFYWKKV